ncbi:hypothetical protein GEMRC1_006110 [Eukaryota sp. GEM-RC1]
MLAGTTIGVLINSYMPPVITSFALSILLFFNGLKTIKKGIKHLSDAKFSVPNERTAILNQDPEDQQQTSSTANSIPIRIIIYFIGEWTLVLVLTVLRGNIEFASPLGISICSPMWWILTLGQVPLASLFSFLSLKVTRPCPSWTRTKCVKLFFLSITAGFIASSLGIGGAMVLQPALLGYGYSILESRSASIFIIVFSSSSSFIQYALFGHFEYEVAFTFMPMCFWRHLLG